MRVISPESHRFLRIEYIVDLPISGDSLWIIIVNSEVVKSELFEINVLTESFMNTTPLFWMFGKKHKYCRMSIDSIRLKFENVNRLSAINGNIAESPNI